MTHAANINQTYVSEGMTLPAWTYRNQEFYDLEVEHIHKKAWQLLCHQNDIPEIGDFRTMQTLGETVFAVRGKDNKIRVFNNVCRHRAHAVVKGEAGNCKGMIRCPYHGWAYNLQGELKAIAAKDSFSKEVQERDDLGLLEVDYEIYMGFIFFRFVSDGPSVAERYKPFEEDFKIYRFEELQPLSTKFYYDTGVDWKNVWDNYLEGYHLAEGHPGLNALTEKGYELNPKRAEKVARFFHQMKTKPQKELTLRAYQEYLDDQPHLPTDFQKSWRYYFMHPGISFDVYPDQMGIYQTLPTGPGQSKLRWLNYGLPDQGDRRLKAARYLNNRINRQVQREDDELIQSVQRGLETSAYNVGYLSDHEVVVKEFQQWIMDELPVARIIKEPTKEYVKETNQMMRGVPLAAE